MMNRCSLTEKGDWVMNVKITFLPPYSYDIGEKQLALNLSTTTMTLRELMLVLFSQYPAFKTRLQGRKLMKGDMPYAMFVVNHQKADFETMLHNGDQMYMFITMCGG